MPDIVTKCIECGSGFHSRADASYCSTACRQRAYRRHRKADGTGQPKIPATAGIGPLISKIQILTSELETHTAAMNYTGTDEFNVHTFVHHEFDRGAYKVLHDVGVRLQAVSNDLYSAQEERQTFDALTIQQKKARTLEFEENSEDAQAMARRDAEFELSQDGR